MIRRRRYPRPAFGLDVHITLSSIGRLATSRQTLFLIDKGSAASIGQLALRMMSAVLPTPRDEPGLRLSDSLSDRIALDAGILRRR